MVKNMKKVICGILCMMMVFSMFTVSAATLTIDEGKIVVSDADAATGLRTVTIPYTVTVASDEEAPAYLTMLASKTETVDANNIGTSAIGIEQIANDPAVTSISFVTDKIEAGVPYYVKMGATNLATPATARFSLAAAGGDPAPATYTVTFYAEADAEAYATKTTDADGKVEAPTAPTKDGFTFAGWATTAGATAADVDLATKVFEADTTLYAVWTEVPASTVMHGDLTGDGRVNIRDAQRIGQYVVKLCNLDGSKPYVAGELTADELAVADVTSDGRVNIRDAQRIGQYVVKLCNLDGSKPYDPNK